MGTRYSARLIAFGLALASCSSVAYAHKTSVRRTVFLEPSGELDLQVIVALRIPSGDARRALELTYSRAAIEQLLKTRALDGLTIHAGDKALELTGVQVKMKAEPDGPIELMIHAVARQPRADLELALSTRALTDPVDLLVLAGTRPVLSASRGTLKAGSLKTEVGQGDRVSWRTAPQTK